MPDRGKQHSLRTCSKRISHLEPNGSGKTKVVEIRNITMTAVTFNNIPAGRNTGSSFKTAKNFLQVLLSNIFTSVSRELAARKAIRALNSYNEHELADIGLSRGQIEDAVRSGR